MLALSWSGGKDSAHALHVLTAAGDRPALLLTTVDESSGAVPHHGIPGPLLRAQADAAGLPLVEVPIPAGGTNEEYARIWHAAFAGPLADVAEVAFGDLHLADVRAYREERMAQAGRGARFPLWGRDPAALAREMLAAGLVATICAVDPAVLPPTDVGRRFDGAFLDDLPATADPCGERGEFHTFVHDGPEFGRPLDPWPSEPEHDGAGVARA